MAVVVVVEEKSALVVVEVMVKHLFATMVLIWFGFCSVGSSV